MLADEGTELTLDGLALLGESQVADTHSFIDHTEPHCTSRQLHKAIVDGRSRAVFNGQHLRAARAPSGTDAQQQSRNLLLSEEAQVDTKPELEIFADDVKCAHGAAVGQLDPEELFYLQSRGLNLATARNLLTYGFAADLLAHIPVPSLRRQLRQAVMARTQADFAGRPAHEHRPPTLSPSTSPGSARTSRSLPAPYKDKPAGLPGQRGERPHAPVRHRAHRPVPGLRAHQCPPGRLPALSQEATDRFEEAREKVRSFINAPIHQADHLDPGHHREHQPGGPDLRPPEVHAGDEILLSAMEHHSNIVPWQLLAEEQGATIRVIPMNDAGELLLDDLDELLTDRTRILGVTQVSNVLGTINPVKEIIARAHAKGVPVLVDGAQAVPHLPVDVQDLDADFYVFTGHKLIGPHGHRRALRQAGAPGGHAALAGRRQHDPLRHLGEDHLSSARPGKFEAGTPPIAAGHRPGRGHRLPPRASAWTASPPTSTSCWPTPPRSV